MRSALTVFCGACVLLLVAPAVTSARPEDYEGLRPDNSAGGSRNCTKAYTYSGAQNNLIRAGIRATITQVASPHVIAGHVAAWLGVGGPGLGPNHTTEWLQTGYAAMKDSPEQIYYEVTRPNIPTQYHTIKASLQPGETHSLAVVEVTPSVWQILLDGNPVSEQIYLPSSHRRFRPQVLAETWNADTNTCNSFAFRFTDIQVSTAPGGYWAKPKSAYLWRDPSNVAQRLSANAFLARSRSLASVTRTAVSFHAVPPVLGALASKLAEKNLTVECVHQTEPVRVQLAARHLLLSKSVCETLVGSIVAQPYAPDPESKTGILIANTQIGFLRGVAQAYGVAPANVDCQVLGWLLQLSRGLGATYRKATKLREAAAETFTTSHGEARLATLWLRPGCPFA